MPSTRATPEPAELIDLDAFLPYRLAVLAAAVSRGLGRVYEERFGLSIAEWRIIANLGAAGAQSSRGLTAGEVAERSTLDKASVTRALQRLEKRRLIARKIDTEDRRQSNLSLTAKGREVFTEISGLARAWEADLLAPLGREARGRLMDMLDTLQARAGELDHEPPKDPK